MKQLRSRKGVTLVELLIVIVVIGILAKNYQETSHLQGYAVPIVSGG